MYRVLIADDDAFCRTLLHEMLAPIGACDLAADGQEAIDAFQRALAEGRPYDLLCLDLMMPSVDGHAALRAIRKLEEENHGTDYPRAKAIITTSLTDTKHCIRAFEEGCESYLPKPICEERLLGEVRSLLGLAEPEPDGPAPMGTADPPAETAPVPKRFLVVDDERVARELLREILSRYGRCDLAYDGSEAITAVRLALEDGDPYDLICLDIMMPDLNGHQTLEAIRALEQTHGVFGNDGARVVMTTALRDSKHCIRAFHEGCEAYITKPIDEKLLVAQIQQLGVLTG